MRLQTMLAAVGFAAALSASSQTFAMPAGAVPAVDRALVEQVAYGCGRGFVPNRWGRCAPAMRPFYVRPRPMYRRPAPYRRYL